MEKPEQVTVDDRAFVVPGTNEELLRRFVEQERQFVKGLPPSPPPDPPTIHYTELAEAPPDSPIAAEWNCYRREVGRLPAEGHEGHWVLVQGEQIVGLWDAFEPAYEAQASLRQSVMLKQVLRREPLLRIGYTPPCRS